MTLPVRLIGIIHFLIDSPLNGQPDDGRMMGDHGYGYGWWMVMGLFWILVIVVIVALFVWAFTGSRIRPRARFGSESGTSRALEILNERYARGEIDKKEFEEKKKDILE